MNPTVVDGLVVIGEVYAGVALVLALACAVCFVCGAAIDRCIDRTVEQAFSAPHEAHVVQALALGNNEPPPSFFDELARRRRTRIGAR